MEGRLVCAGCEMGLSQPTVALKIETSRCEYLSPGWSRECHGETRLLLGQLPRGRARGWLPRSPCGGAATPPRLPDPLVLRPICT